MYRVGISPKAKNQLKLLKEAHRLSISLIIEELKTNPFIGKPLSRELECKYSYRVGAYRIIYLVNKRDRKITVLSAGHRSYIYD